MGADEESEEDTERSDGRGLLVDEDLPAETREEMAAEMATTVRERRRSEWFPE